MKNYKPQKLRASHQTQKVTLPSPFDWGAIITFETTNARIIVRAWTNVGTTTSYRIICLTTGQTH